MNGGAVASPRDVPVIDIIEIKLGRGLDHAPGVVAVLDSFPAAAPDAYVGRVATIRHADGSDLSGGVFRNCTAGADYQRRADSMADNTQWNPGSGGDVLKAKNLGAYKLAASTTHRRPLGVDAGPISTANPLPVSIGYFPTS